MSGLQHIDELTSAAIERAHNPTFGLDTRFIAYLKLEIVDRIQRGKSLDSDAYRALLKLAGKAY